MAIRNEEPFVDSYYRRSVVGGMNSFLMVAEDYEDFAAAILVVFALLVATAFLFRTLWRSDSRRSSRSRSRRSSLPRSTTRRS